MILSKRLVAIGFLLLGGALAEADIAAACFADCVLVSPPFCRRCRDVGEFTGITCQNFSNCGCFYTQNTCNSLAASGEDGFLNDLGAVAAGVCTDGADPAEAQPAERS